MIQIAEAARPLKRALRSVDPDSVSGPEAASAVSELAEIKKVCDAALARFAARAETLGAHKSRGHASGAQWMAKSMGITPAQAQRSMDTARALEDLPRAKEAYVSGRISEQQAAQVAKAAAVDPSAEARLVQTAQTRDFQSLREEARNVVLDAQDVEGLHRRQHKAREFTHWVDEEGMVAGKFRLPPEIGAPLVNRIDTETDRIFRKAYKEGGREPRVAYAADALAAMLSSPSGSKPSRGADLVLVCDHDAYKRGHVHKGERCHIPGVGPVPVDVARDIAQDAFLKGVLIDGCEIKKVRHFGRHIKAEVRTALELGEPPELNGAVCVEEGCGRRTGLQWDHVDPVANRGPTSYKNVKPMCGPDHDKKTAADRARGLHRHPTRRRKRSRAGPSP